MNEAKAKAIYTCKDLSCYTHDELVQCDLWVKQYALEHLRTNLLGVVGMRKPHSDFILMMATYHYGTVEVDEFLTKLRCYPHWLVRLGQGRK